MGAEFAAGFLYGTKVGGFDEKSLYECLQKEPRADDLFLKADNDLKMALYKHDPNKAMHAISEMIEFIMDIATEVTLIDEDMYAPTCPELVSKSTKWGHIHYILNEWRNKQTGIKYD